MKVRIDLERLKPANQGSINTIPPTGTLFLNWIKSKLILNDIPTTHLFPDPAVVQDECLNMFTLIKAGWMLSWMEL